MFERLDEPGLSCSCQGGGIGAPAMPSSPLHADPSTVRHSGRYRRRCQAATSVLLVTAHAYLARLAEVIGTEVALVGVGPDRAQSILHPGSWLIRNVPDLI